MEQDEDLFTLPEQMSSPPVSSAVRVARSLVFCVMLCGSSFVSFCLLAIVLSGLLRFTDSDYPFDIYSSYILYYIINS